MFSTANQQWWNTTNQTCATTENIEDRDSRPESSSAPKKISQLTFLRSKYIINRSNTALVGQKLQLLNRSINLDSFTLISFTFFLLNLIHCHTFFWKIRSKQISMVPSKNDKLVMTVKLKTTSENLWTRRFPKKLNPSVKTFTKLLHLWLLLFYDKYFFMINTFLQLNLFMILSVQKS